MTMQEQAHILLDNVHGALKSLPLGQVASGEMLTNGQPQPLQQALKQEPRQKLVPLSHGQVATLPMSQMFVKTV